MIRQVVCSTTGLSQLLSCWAVIGIMFIARTYLLSWAVYFLQAFNFLTVASDSRSSNLHNSWYLAEFGEFTEFTEFAEFTEPTQKLVFTKAI